MALLKCPECDLQVSDKALTCPHCGYPLKQTPSHITRKKKKRRKLPNGFGSITKLNKENLRSPYLARVCVGKTPEGRPILKHLRPKAYFPTYNDAYAALVEYNRNPYDLEPDMTMRELYDKWFEKYAAETASAAYIRSMEACWLYFSSIYDMRVKDVRARHIKGCMENGYRIEYRGKNKGQKVYPTAGTKSRMKSLANLMFDYAVEYEIAEKNYARTFELSGQIIKEVEENKVSHICFTVEEIDLLWENVDKVQFADWVLIQMYMGWRPQELATLRLDEISLDEWYIKSGMKTEAGRQRIVPIHPKIRGLVTRNYEFAKSIGSEYLLNDKGQTHSGSWRVTYDKYRKRFLKVMDALHLNPKHRAHDPRKTFITFAQRSGMDRLVVKLFVGHSVQDITESVYTERDIEWLHQDMAKLEYIKGAPA